MNNEPSVGQLNALNKKMHNWVDAYLCSPQYQEFDGKDVLSQAQYVSVVGDFAQQMLTEYGRQPSRWTAKTMLELIQGEFGQQLIVQLAENRVQIDLPLLAGILYEFLDFATSAGLLRNGLPLLRALGDFVEREVQNTEFTDMAEQLTAIMNRVRQFYNISDDQVHNRAFVQEHLAEYFILADGATFMQLAVIAAMAVEDGDFDLGNWFEKFVLPEINLTPEAVATPNAKIEFIMDLQNDVQPIGAANRLAIAMRVEGIELKDADLTAKITFQQRHRAALKEVPAMLNYLPKEELSRRQKDTSARKNNVLSFAAAKKLAKKRNKRK